jgi:hypothetical protein
MSRLPVLKKRRTRKQRALDVAKKGVKVAAAVKVSVVGARAAKKGAKAYGAAKDAKVAGRPLLKVAAVPVAVGGGVIVWRKAKGSGSNNGSGADAGRSVGPVAHADSVSPPADAAAETARSNEVPAS